MSREVLDHCWATFRDSACRLETLQAYAVPQEDAAWQAFTRGRPLPRRTADTNPWLAKVAAHTAAGRRICRAHIVDLPLSPYLQFELLGYRDNQAAGEDIYLVHRQAHPDFAGFHEDGWLFDDRVLVKMQYDDQGQFLSTEHEPGRAEVADYRRRWDLVMRHAISLNDYLSTEQEYRTA